MKTYIRLSYILDIKDPLPPSIPAPQLRPLYTIEKDKVNSQVLQLANHTGTHVDSPRHVIENGLSILDFSLEEFIFQRPIVLDFRLEDGDIVGPNHLIKHMALIGGADIAIFRFGYAQARKTDPNRFVLRSPGFGVEAAKWLKANFKGLRAIGMDVPSFSCSAHLDQTMSAHNEILGGEGRRFMIIEDMDLSHNLTGLTEIHVHPWLVQGMDSGPCTVIGVMNTR